MDVSAPKCWGCGGLVELKHYPASICEACNRTGGGVAARSPLRRDPDKEKVLRIVEKVIDSIKELRRVCEEALEAIDNA